MARPDEEALRTAQRRGAKKLECARMPSTFSRAVWLLPLVFAVHEAEEWNILAWYRVRWDNPPAVTELSVWTWLVGITLVAALWTLVGWLPRRPRLTAHVVLPFFLVTVFANALQHLVLLVVDGAYNPGLVTATSLLVPVIGWVTLLALREKLVPRWYVALWLLLAVPSVVSLARAGRTLPVALRSIYELSSRASLALFGQV